MTNTLGTVYYSSEAWTKLEEYIAQNEIINVFLIIDNYIEVHCLPHFIKNFKCSVCEIIRIPTGEKNKNIATTLFIWETLAHKKADKNSLIINLGGGMITDIGGFAASTYKRGMPFVHIPTTLLAMVDAAVGGKTGIDLHHVKNQIGTISLPQLIVIDTEFLNSLPHEQFLSGMAEVIKHALIEGDHEWERISKLNLEDVQSVYNIIPDSIAVKQKIVEIDPLEKKERKILNYGHTLGHAIETYSMGKGQIPLLHGEAIAIGMILETYLSYRIYGFPKDKLEAITEFILSLFRKQFFDETAIKEIINLMIYDKKNSNGIIKFVLMKNLGDFALDCEVHEPLIYEAFLFYHHH